MMSRALFVVILSRDSWWVDFEGKAHGPFASRETAADEARQLAQFSAHSGRESEVLVPDDSGRHRVIWSSVIEPHGVGGAFVPHRAAE
jgi:hypothetical protein